MSNFKVALEISLILNRGSEQLLSPFSRKCLDLLILNKSLLCLKNKSRFGLFMWFADKNMINKDFITCTSVKRFCKLNRVDQNKKKVKSCHVVHLCCDV